MPSSEQPPLPPPEYYDKEVQTVDTIETVVPQQPIPVVEKKVEEAPRSIPSVPKNSLTAIKKRLFFVRVIPKGLLLLII